MRFPDLLLMSIGNLKRRKMRTFLTVLGVVIGTTSVVTMVSLGIGLNAMMVDQYASYGDMTSITVYSGNYSFNGDSTGEELQLTDDTVKQFRGMEHVTGVSPMLNINVILRQGVYEMNTELSGVSRDYLEKIPLAEGYSLDSMKDTMKFIYGNSVIRWFWNSKSHGGGYNSEELADVDYDQPMFVIFDVNAYYQSQNAQSQSMQDAVAVIAGSGGGGGEQIKPPKKYMVETAGVVEGEVNDYNGYSYSIYTDVDLLKEELKRIFKKNPIPGQPTNKKGKPYPYFIYDRMVVFVDDMENVMAVQQALTDMGYHAESQMEWIEQAQQTFGMVQMVLGGIGAISLFVAAIGIANTMMMSIYERTKEIGVIKVLGCDLGNIRNMFLLESGFIGFMGGAAGLILSYGIGFLLNRVLSLGQVMTGVAGDISRIPLWLAVFAIIFAILVGMAAGFFPSLRAMRLSPLAAIRNE